MDTLLMLRCEIRKINWSAPRRIAGLNKITSYKPSGNRAFENGSFIKAKEMVNGYLIVNAKDINEGAEISKGFPIFQANGKVEVRPVQKLEN